MAGESIIGDMKGDRFCRSRDPAQEIAHRTPSPLTTPSVSDSLWRRVLMARRHQATPLPKPSRSPATLPVHLDSAGIDSKASFISSLVPPY